MICGKVNEYCFSNTATPGHSKILVLLFSFESSSKNNTGVNESHLPVEVLFQAKAKLLQDGKNSRLSQRMVREELLLFGDGGCGLKSAVVFFICFLLYDSCCLFAAGNCFCVKERRGSV